MTEPEHYNLRLSGALRSEMDEVDLSLEYTNLNSVRGLEGTSQQYNGVSLDVRLPLEESLYVYQSLAWEQDIAGGEQESSLRYNAEADLPIFEGNARPQAGLGYNLITGTFDALNLGASYYGLLTNNVDLFAGSGLYLEEESFFYLVAGGSYGLNDRQALNFSPGSSSRGSRRWRCT